MITRTSGEIIFKANGNIDHSAHEALRHGIERSPHWHIVEKGYILNNPLCACCKNMKYKVQVHHIFPFHYVVALGRPDLELDPRNLISLCESEKGFPADNHHLLIGHLDDFKSSNIHVTTDVALFSGLSSEQVQSNNLWLAKKTNRLPKLDEMTETDKQAFIHLMNSVFPLNK